MVATVPSAISLDIEGETDNLLRALAQVGKACRDSGEKSAGVAGEQPQGLPAGTGRVLCMGEKMGWCSIGKRWSQSGTNISRLILRGRPAGTNFASHLAGRLGLGAQYPDGRADVADDQRC